MTKEQFDRLKSQNPNDTVFGTITKVVATL
jgi:hypothetical protein